MTAKKRGLGKGLDALLGSQTEVTLAGPDTQKTLPVDLIQRGQYQPRHDMEQTSLEDLASSIRAQGVVQPIVVRPLAGSDRYEIIAGERRWRAAQMAGLHEIPAVVREVGDQDAMCMALIENIQREDLNSLEEAQALARLLKEFKMTHVAVAEAVGRSRSSVSNLLRLLDLNDEVKKFLDSGDLEMGHGRALLALPPDKQVKAAKTIIRRGLSVRATESLVKKLSAEAKNKKTAETKIDPDIRRLQDDLSQRLGAKVVIKQQSKGRGVLQINYHSLDELDGILKRIK
ncbi:MAG: ParB/RepB/Spo0J family partition protein [Gammaproteobacteria bacterium]